MSQALEEAIREIVRKELQRAGIAVPEQEHDDDDDDEIRRRATERAAALRARRGR